MRSSSRIFALALGATILVASSANAADEHNVSTGVTEAGVPLGLHGADTVILAGSAKLSPGSAVFTAVHDGVSYYFESEDSMKKFQAAPADYTPQFGGFCAFAVSIGKKLDGDPRYADVVDGKLYVSVNAEIFERYKQDRAGTIAKANVFWKKIEHTQASVLW